MRLDDERESDNVEDRRGGGMGRVGGIGIGGVAIALVAGYFLGIDPRVLLGLAETVQSAQQSTTLSPANRQIDPATDPDAATKREVRKVLAKTEDTWARCFGKWAASIELPSWFYIRAPPQRHAVPARQRWGRFIVRGIPGSIWT